MIRARSITTFRTDDEASNRFQEHLKEVLNPVLRSLSASPAWATPPLLNGWVSWGPPFDPVGYYKDVNGRVWMRGTVRSGTIGAAIFQLPSGFRPLNAHDIVVRSSNGVNDVAAYLRVQSDGNVLAGGGSNVSFAVEGSFLAEAAP